MTELSCESCFGACCRKGVYMEMSQEEANYMWESGAKLFPVLPALPGKSWKLEFKRQARMDPEWLRHAKEKRDDVKLIARRLRVGEGLYKLLADCPNLEAPSLNFPKCLAREDSNRPEICGDFTAGSELCIKLHDELIKEMLEDARMGVPGNVPIELIPKPIRPVPVAQNPAA